MARIIAPPYLCFPTVLGLFVEGADHEQTGTYVRRRANGLECIYEIGSNLTPPIWAPEDRGVPKTSLSWCC